MPRAIAYVDGFDLYFGLLTSRLKRRWTSVRNGVAV